MTHLKPVLSLVENHHELTTHSPPNSALPIGYVESRKESSRYLSDLLITHVWTRMQSLYPNWNSIMGISDNGHGYLSDTARTWQRQLKDVTVEHLKHGFNALSAIKKKYPPNVFEFHDFCVGGSSESLPGLDKIIAILTTVSSKKGSIVIRYQHPLIFAIAQQIDMHGLRMASMFDARRMIKETYNDFVAHGYPDFPDHAYTDPVCITHTPKPADKNLGRNALHALREKL